MKRLLFLVLAFVGTMPLAARAAEAPPPVTVTEDDTYYTLSNGILTAKVHKKSGDLISLLYKGLETMGHGAGHPAGYWEQEPSLAPQITARKTIDPQKNGGERAEVSVKGVTGGTVMLTPNAPGGGTTCDIEIRYALGRGDSGIYTYAVFSHPETYPAATVGESRFGLKLNGDIWDWLTIDKDRNKLMATGEDWDQGTTMNLAEARYLNTGIYKGTVEHKYDYAALQFEIPAYGWSSTKHHIGIWFINPTIEYLSGGAGKVELTGHIDNGSGKVAILLDYWRGTHYGSAQCDIAAGEKWEKVVGPIYLYLNSVDAPKSPAKDAASLWSDALAQAKKQTSAWPFAWVQGVDYPPAAERGSVAGQLVLDDPQAAAKKLPNLRVGLAHPDYTVVGRGGRGGADAGMVDWQHDAKFYQFWIRGDEDGKFQIPQIRPGTYTLHAYADGVLGEFAQANIVVAPGQSLDLGQLKWRPVRYGKQLWDIGVANRSGGEFYGGNNYWHWGWYLHYATLFPNDITYTIGQSDFRKDWFFEQVPHAQSQNFREPGRETTWAVKFNLADTPRGTGHLRVAVAGADASNVRLGINGQDTGQVLRVPSTGAIRRDGITGAWVERDLPFDAALMKKGENVLTLTLPGGVINNGLIYDYLRLELDEARPYFANP